MIDYDKLKTLTGNALKQYLGKIVEHAQRRLDLHKYELEGSINLKEKLTQQEPKYKVGDTLWLIYDQKPLCFNVEAVNFRSNKKFMYQMSGGYPGAGFEENLYPTKAALIKAQIEYWSNMREPIKLPMMTDYDDQYCTHPEVIGSFGGIKFICTHCGKHGLTREQNQEYCNVSGVKLGKQEECEHRADTSYVMMNGELHSECKKCGEFYR